MCGHIRDWCESVLKNEAFNLGLIFMLRARVDCDSASEAAAEYNEWDIFCFWYLDSFV